MSERNGPAGPQVLQGFDVLPPLGEPTLAPAGPKRKAREPVNRGAGDRFRTINAFLDVTARTLPPSAVLVWVLLWRDVKPDGLARTSQVDLARRSGLCLRTVKAAVKRLRSVGLIETVQRGNLRNGPSAYRLHPVVAAAGE